MIRRCKFNGVQTRVCQALVCFHRNLLLIFVHSVSRQPTCSTMWVVAQSTARACREPFGCTSATTRCTSSGRALGGVMAASPGQAPAAVNVVNGSGRRVNVGMGTQSTSPGATKRTACVETSRLLQGYWKKPYTLEKLACKSVQPHETTYQHRTTHHQHTID